MSGGYAPAAALVAVNITFTVIAVTAVALRLVTRLLIVKNAGVDDAFIGVAAVRTACIACR
jgi:hypothetical protein